jgi:hypothetical protein
MRSWLAALVVLGASTASSLADDTARITISKLLTDGGQLISVQTSQQWPFFYITTPDRHLYACSMDYNEGYNFFDSRQPPPATVGSRCSEIK